MVADGLGGHAGGALAAEVVIETVERCWRERDVKEAPEEFLRGAVQECHDAVNKKRDETAQDPRSTLAMLFGHRSGLTSIHAGDSRVMQFDDKNLANRTKDHSVAQLQLQLGEIKEEELNTHPSKNKLLTHIGGESTPEAEVETWNPSEGQRFVVCSDGFWEIFPEDEIMDLLDSEAPCELLETRFEEKLKHLERQDNTTAILAEVDYPDAAQGSSRVSGAVASALLGLVLIGGLTQAHAARPAPQVQSQGPASASENVSAAERLERNEPIRLLAQVTEREAAESQHREGPGGRAAGTEGVATEGEPGSSERDSRILLEGGPVSLGRREIRTDLEIGDQDDVSAVVADELRKVGGIGEGDSLVAGGEAAKLGDVALVRLRQVHKDIPVYGAEVVVSKSNGRVVKIQGHPAPGIDIETQPVNDYRATLALAGGLIGRSVEPLDDGELVVFAVGPGTYRLAWKGAVEIDRVAENAVFDCETGKILLRVPVGIGSRSPTADVGAESARSGR